MELYIEKGEVRMKKVGIIFVAVVVVVLAVFLYLQDTRIKNLENQLTSEKKTTVIKEASSNSNEKKETAESEQIKWFNTIAEMEFETPTNQGVTVTTEKLQSGITYPKVSLPTSKTVETKINQIFYNEALNAQALDKDAKEMQSEQKASGSWSPVFGDYGAGLSYTVPFNQEGFISVIVARTANGFGMGTNSLQHYIGTFDLTSGEQLTLSAWLDDSRMDSQLQEIKNYMKKQMINENNKNPEFPVYDLSLLDFVDIKYPSYYLTQDGITICFNPINITVTGGGTGLICFNIPYSVFK